MHPNCWFDEIGDKLREEWCDLLATPLPARLHDLASRLDAPGEEKVDMAKVLGALLNTDEPTPETSIVLQDLRQAVARANHH
jgi:hypothetical protein